MALWWGPLLPAADLFNIKDGSASLSIDVALTAAATEIKNASATLAIDISLTAIGDDFSIPYLATHHSPYRFNNILAPDNNKYYSPNRNNFTIL